MTNQSQQARAAIFAKLKAAPRQTVSVPLPEWQAWQDGDVNVRADRLAACMTTAHTEIVRATSDNLLEQLVACLRENGFKNLLLGKDNPFTTDLSHADLECEIRTYDQPIDGIKGDLFNHTDASLSVIPAAIADTGTLALVTGEKEPRALSLVPPTHIAILRECDIVSNFSDLMTSALWQQAGWDTRPPTNLLLISGPSKTADIQQTLAYGAHGPKRLIVFMVKE
ncbi:lactate utilization protein C [Enterovibrio sp. 27052020O]|uniref:LutC/YkgG family protein n=1 Tax=Enterovibrio sp. 27052020O TaxID=3241166 RepID=UPI00388E3FF9